MRADFEDGHVRLDPVLVEQPPQHLGGAIGAVTKNPARIKIEPFERALDHALGGQHFRLADRRGRLDIDDDRVLNVDQVVRRIRKVSLSAVRSRPARRRIGGRHELRRDLRRSTERGIIKNGKVFIDCSTRGLRWKPLAAFDTLLPDWHPL